MVKEEEEKRGGEGRMEKMDGKNKKKHLDIKCRKGPSQAVVDIIVDRLIMHRALQYCTVQ